MSTSVGDGSPRGINVLRYRYNLKASTCMHTRHETE
jgi:hypothetical protein